MGQQSGPEGSDKNVYSLLWMLAGVGCVVGGAWYLWSDQLKTGFIKIRLYEALAIGYFSDRVEPLIEWLRFAGPGDLTTKTAIQVSEQVGTFLRIPIVGILALMMLYLFRTHISMRFTKTYNIDTLAAQEKQNWPQISPVIDLDLVSQDIRVGPWAMAMNPMQFAKHYQLLKVELIHDRKAVWRHEGITKATLLKDKAEQVFYSQLGPLWRGVDALAPYTKALYAVFLARLEHEAEVARAYLSELSIEAAKGSLTFSQSDALIKKYGQGKAAQLCLTRHAYVYTVMASMLELSRLDGVLASADFLWLKPVDRSLWYVLNTVGRQVAPSEVAGIMAHWLAEKEMHRPLSVPMVQEAINGLEKGLANMIYIAEADEELSFATE